MIRQQRSLALVLGVVLAMAATAALARAADNAKKETPTSSHPFVGVRVGETENEQGVAVGQVVPDSPAAKAGLKTGDVITRVDGREIDSPDTLQNVLARHKPGETLNFHVKRDGKARTLKVTLGKAPKETEIGREPEGEEQEPGSAKRHAFLGVQAIPVDELTPRLKKRLGISNEEGLVVMEVVPDSPASKAGLQHGDVITQINGKDVTDIEDLIKPIRKAGVGKTLPLTVLRGKEKKHMEAKLEASPVGGLGPIPPTRRFFPGEGPGLGGRFPLGPFEAQRKIERLEKRIQVLEKRLQDLEKRSGTEKKPAQKKPTEKKPTEKPSK